MPVICVDVTDQGTFGNLTLKRQVFFPEVVHGVAGLRKSSAISSLSALYLGLNVSQAISLIIRIRRFVLRKETPGCNVLPFAGDLIKIAVAITAITDLRLIP
jgi:hypothetical protein